MVRFHDSAVLVDNVEARDAVRVDTSIQSLDLQTATPQLLPYLLSDPVRTARDLQLLLVAIVML